MALQVPKSKALSHLSILLVLKHVEHLSDFILNHMFTNLLLNAHSFRFCLPKPFIPRCLHEFPLLHLLTRNDTGKFSLNLREHQLILRHHSHGLPMQRRLVTILLQSFLSRQ